MWRYLPRLVVLFVAVTGNTDTKVDVARLEARYRVAKTLQASFLERYKDNGRVVRSEAGTAYFLRPGKMRWDYQAPEKNLFLVDGKMAWFYVPADHTVTRVPAKQSADWRTPLALLVGDMKLSKVCERVFAAIEEKPENPDDAVLYCELRGASSRSRQGAPGAARLKPSVSEAVLLEIDPRSGDLVRVVTRDPGGIEIEFRFTDWRIDPPLPESLFRFDAPRGVAIVNGELSLGDSSVKH
jgi:outer membrane lipoprotein carrier protein